MTMFSDPDAIMPDVYDREGQPMTYRDYQAAFETRGSDNEYRRVAETTVSLPDGGSVWVSTVWLGHNHNFAPSGRPLIFETMIFPSKDGPLNELDCFRWHTEREALESHHIICRRLHAGQSLDDL